MKTIEDVVKKLNNCAANGCKNCEFNVWYDIGCCEAELIKAAGEACRQIVENGEAE